MVREKSSALQKLAAKIAADESLPLREANLVFGEGNPEAEIMFIGEAPGANEDREGRPFIGRAGKLLRSYIRALHWEEEDAYITNIVKRRPPENRDPTPEEIAAYKPYLAEQIRIIHPKIIATLGRFSMNYFLPDAKISRDHGKLFLLRDILLFPLYHPAAALRATSMKMELEKDFQKLPQILKAYDSLILSTQKEAE